MYSEEFKEDLLNKARSKYPLGTKYISLMGMSDNIKENTTIRLAETNIVAVTDYGSTRILVNYNEPEKWAKVTESVNQENNNYLIY